MFLLWFGVESIDIYDIIANILVIWKPKAVNKMKTLRSYGILQFAWFIQTAYIVKTKVMNLKSEMNALIYLDNSATTRVLDSAARVALKYMTEDYYNPSSMYRRAVNVEKDVNNARARMAASLGASADELYFTSGGTESDNIAILGTAAALREGKYRFITTEMEHPAVYDVFNALEKTGQEVIRLTPDSAGNISPAQVAEAVNGRTALVSIMHVNNEFGAVADLRGIASAIRAKNPNAYFHSDGVQAYCKLAETAVPVDMYSISSHKIHGPKGMGALLVKKRVKSAGGLIGGGQERGFRSGTTNAPGIMAMYTAAQHAMGRLKENEAHMRKLKLMLAEGLQRIPDVYINGPAPQSGAAHILNVSFLGVRGEVLLHSLEDMGIMVSTGSACSSHKKGKNRVLASIGVTGERAEGAIRFSLCPFNTEKEMTSTIEAVTTLVTSLRRFKRR